MASDAVRLTETLRVATAAIGAQVKGKTPQQLLTEAARAVTGSNFADAEKLAGAAITAAPKDPANWLAYAGIAAAADDAKANDRYQIVTPGRDRGLCRLSAFDDARRAGRGARRARRSARAPRAMAPRARRLEGLARPPRLGRRAQDLRGDARRARLPHSRLQGRQRIRSAARLLQLLRAARAPDRFFALCRGIRLVRDGDLERGPADLRRGPQARRALRDRAAPGPALGGRRIAAQVRRLRDLRARPLAAGAFRRPGLRAAAPGPEGRAARHRQHREGLDRRLSRRRPQSARDRQSRRFPQAHRLVAGGGDRLAGRRESLERDDGRRLRAQPGRRDRLSGARRGRQARARNLCRHRAAVERRGESRRCETPTRACSSPRNGWWSPISA